MISDRSALDAACRDDAADSVAAGFEAAWAAVAQVDGEAVDGAMFWLNAQTAIRRAVQALAEPSDGAVVPLTLAPVPATAPRLADTAELREALLALLARVRQRLVDQVDTADRDSDAMAAARAARALEVVTDPVDGAA